jgi:hypothetical protein
MLTRMSDRSLARRYFKDLFNAGELGVDEEIRSIQAFFDPAHLLRPLGLTKSPG